MTKYRKKPVVVEAIRYRPDQDPCNCAEVAALIGYPYDPTDCTGMDDDEHTTAAWDVDADTIAAPGDWIIRYPNGALDVYAPDIFAATYEEVEE